MSGINKTPPPVTDLASTLIEASPHGANPVAAGQLNPTPNVTASGALPATLSEHTALAQISLPSHPYAAKIYPEDRSAKKQRLNSHKSRIAKKLEAQFKTPTDPSTNSKYGTKALIVNSAFIHGPSGSFPSDVFLDRALKNLEKEKMNCDSKDGASNIVIIGRRKSSCERMARRLLRMANPRDRTDLESRIEVLDSYNIETQNEQTPKSPKIIFIPSESLTTVLSKKGKREELLTDSRSEANVKRDLTKLVRHIDLDRLKYLYFDHAHTMTSRGKSMIFDYLKKNMDGRVGTGFQEIIGTSYCTKYHVDDSDDNDDNDDSNVHDIRNQLEHHHSLPSPGELYRVAMPDTMIPQIKVTSIGLELPGDEQIPGRRKNYTFEHNFAYNEAWIKEHLIEGKSQADSHEAQGLEANYQEILDEGVTNPRIMISTKRIKTAQIIRDLLIDKGYKVGITNTKDGHKYYSSKDEETSIEDRTDLIDKFGKDFNILIHCGSLDGEEIPADLTIVYKIPDSSESLESFTSSFRTPFPEEEDNPELLSERPRRLWLLDRAVKEEEDDSIKDTSYVRAVLNLIEARHLQGASGAGSAQHSRTGDHGLGHINLEGLTPDQILRLRQPGITDQNPYVISGHFFGGNPIWLEYLDKEILKNIDAKTLDKKISTLCRQVANNTDFQNEIKRISSDKNLKPSSDEIELVLRGLPSGLEIDIQRAVLLNSFFEAGSELTPEEIVVQFPYVTGIASPEEVKACINHALANHEITGPQAVNPWGHFLNTSYGNEDTVNTLIARFLFEHLDYDQRGVLYKPEELYETVAVIKNTQEPSSEDSEEAELKQKFEEFLVTNQDTATKFSTIAAHEIRPNDYPLPNSVSVISAIADINYLEREGLIQRNEAWLTALDSAIGLGPDKREALTCEFLIRSQRESFSSKEALAHSVNLLTGGIKAESDQDKDLIRAYTNHINRNSIRLTPILLNTHFPETFPLASCFSSGGDALSTVRTTLDTTLSQNPSWKKILTDCKDAAENENDFLARTYNEYFTTLNPDDRNAVFSNTNSLREAVDTLHNARKGTPNEKKLLVNFYNFMKTKYTKNFNLIKAQKELAKLISLNTEAGTNNFAAARITYSAVTGSNIKSPWQDILKSTSLKALLAVKIAKFLRTTNRSKEFKNIEDISNILLGSNTLPKNTVDDRRKLFREFSLWLETDLGIRFDRSLLARSFPEYFDYSDTVVTEEDLSLRIASRLDSHEQTINQEWLDLVEETLAKYNAHGGEPISLARYLARCIKEQGAAVRINSEADLIANLGVLVACEPIGTRRHLVNPSAFAQKIKHDNSGLTIAKIISFFPGALEGIVKDIRPQDPHSIEESLKELFEKQFYPQRNIAWYDALKNYLNVEDLVPTFARFLSQYNGNQFSTDADLRKTMLALVGHRITIDQKEASTKKLLLDFIDFIHDKNASISIKLLAHTLFHETIPMTAEEVRQELNDYTAIYQEVGGNVVPVNNRAIRNEAKAVDPLSPNANKPEAQTSEQVIGKITKQYNLSQVNLFALAGVPLLDDPNIWDQPIQDALKRALYVNPDTNKVKLKTLSSIARLIQESAPPSRTISNAETITMPSPHARDLERRKQYLEQIPKRLIELGVLRKLTDSFNIRTFLKTLFPEVKEYQEATVYETIIRHAFFNTTTATARLIGHKIKLSNRGLISFINDSEDPEPRWRMYLHKFNHTEGNKPNFNSIPSQTKLEDNVAQQMNLPIKSTK